jgi:hypothetical protein
MPRTRVQLAPAVDDGEPGVPVRDRHPHLQATQAREEEDPQADPRHRYTIHIHPSSTTIILVQEKIRGSHILKRCGHFYNILFKKFRTLIKTLTHSLKKMQFLQILLKR